MKLLRQNQSGFTLVELAVSMVVMAILVVSLLELLTTSIGAVATGKAHSMGLELANEKMEYLRNLPYDSLSTQSGTILPHGTIADSQNIVRNNYRFRVSTVIKFVDDPYDGNDSGTIPGKPVDLYNYDYKKAEISVYLMPANTKMATLTTNISAKAAETSTNTGILHINVQDANGQPVSNATVTISDTTSPTPAFTPITTSTDSTGLVVIPKLPPNSANKYQVTASLVGYNSDQTYADPAGTQIAVNTNPNVIVQQITNVTLSIDRLATLTTHVVDTSGNPITTQSVTVTGSKKKYTNPTVYLNLFTQSTDGSGDFIINNIPWDSYSFTVPAGKYVVTTSPMLPTVNPNSNTPVTVTLTSSSTWPTIATLSPVTDDVGSNPSQLTLTGTNFSSSTAIKLTRAGQPDIVGTSVTRTGTTTVKANFNLVGTALGAWNVVVTNSVGSATAVGAFNVTP